MRIRISKMFHFEMAHALKNYDGLCKNIHGHSYNLIVTVSGIPISDENNQKLGMVMDFSELKNLIKSLIVEKFDHALVVKKGYFDKINNIDTKLIETNFQPTSENLVIHFVELVKEKLSNSNLRLEKIKLFETSNSFAEWLRTDNE